MCVNQTTIVQSIPAQQNISRLKITDTIKMCRYAAVEKIPMQNSYNLTASDAVEIKRGLW